MFSSTKKAVKGVSRTISIKAFLGYFLIYNDDGSRSPFPSGCLADPGPDQTNLSRQWKKREELAGKWSWPFNFVVKICTISATSAMAQAGDSF